MRLPLVPRPIAPPASDTSPRCVSPATVERATSPRPVFPAAVESRGCGVLVAAPQGAQPRNVRAECRSAVGGENQMERV
jgi:hypothetical protein